MKLSDATLLPGVVVNAEDPKHLGRIQCVIAGKSNPDTMNTEQLPWCAPFMVYGYQRMSKPMEGQKVWILHDETNYYEYYYIPAWDVNQNSSIIPPENDYDILVSRPGEGFGAQSFYTSEQGFVQRIGNDISTTMKGDNSIVSTDNNVEYALRDNHIYNGAVGGEYEPSVLGDKLYNLLSDLSSKLNSASIAANSNCYTTNLAQPLSDCAQAITNLIEEIKSEYVFVN